MTAAGRIGQRLRRLGPARAAAGFLLGIVGALMLLMFAVIFQAMRYDTSATQAANLGQWEQSAIPLRSPLPLSNVPGLWLLRGDVALHNARIKEQTRAATDAFEGPFAAPLHSIERIVISGARLWLNAGREPRAVSAAPEIAAFYHLLEPLQRLAFDTLVLQGASMTTQRLTSGQQTIERLDAEIRAAPGRGVTSASGRFHHRSEPVAFEASLQPVVARLGRWTMPARITTTSRHLSAAFDGIVQFDSGIRLDGLLELRAPSLPALAQWLGVALPEGVDGRAFSAKGKAAWRNGVLTFEPVAVELDGQVAQGAISMSMAGPRLFIDGALAFERLDITTAMTWFGLAAPVSGSGGEPAVSAGSRPARVLLFDSVDADLRLSATHVMGLGVPAGRLAASLTAKGGQVVADVAEIEIANGSAAGQITIDQRGEMPAYRVRGSVNHADTAAWLAMAHLPAVLSGSSNLRFELTGRGRSLAESAAASAGNIHLTLPASGRMQMDVAALFADARDRKTFSFSAHQRRESDFERFDARLALRQGALVSEHISLRRDGLAVTADGVLQSRVGRIYLRLSTDHGQGLARTARLGRSQSILIHGEIGNPTVVLEEAIGSSLPATIAGPQASPQPRRE